MRTAVIFGLLFLLAGSASAGEKQRFTWLLPEGADGDLVIDRIRDGEAWSGTVEDASWAPTLRAASIGWSPSGSMDIELAMPEESDPDDLDAIVKRCYELYRTERLGALPDLVAKAQADLDKARRGAAGWGKALRHLLESGTGVIDRERAIANTAERAEDLRRRVVDARMELAVAEARIRGIREQVMARRKTLESKKQARIKAMEEDLERMFERAQLTPTSSMAQVRRDEIDAARRQPLPEDDLLTSFLRKLADLELDQIAGEERVKAFGEALAEEQERGVALLQAKDLESFRRARILPAEKALRDRERALAGLEEEYAAVRSGQMPRRVEPGSTTGALPRVYLLGAVNHPGAFLIDEAGSGGTMTLTKLLALAGDVGKFADTSAIHILRKEQNRTRRIIVDLEDIIDLEVRDPELRPEDLVFVPEALF